MPKNPYNNNLFDHIGGFELFCNLLVLILSFFRFHKTSRYYKHLNYISKCNDDVLNDYGYKTILTAFSHIGAFAGSDHKPLTSQSYLIPTTMPIP